MEIFRGFPKMTSAPCAMNSSTSLASMLPVEGAGWRVRRGVRGGKGGGRIVCVRGG